jgi:ATP synthase protein I
MNKMPASPDSKDELEDELNEPVFKRWTANEARQLREKSPSVSPWRVVGWQVIAGIVIALGAWLISGDRSVSMSAGYGAIAVILPAIVFAQGALRKKIAFNAGLALGSIFFWELVKIVLTVVMLLAAPKLISNLNWLVLLAGFVLTIKVYWVTLFVSMVRNKSVVKLN